ncbi:type II secretion system protein GspM [Pseudomonas sp. R5(2019)]|uniref:type II secretion system protein GspM n=1 Tax=Pseudomonas sp. R5(2019) TaxID=2697566 RepID=UPI001411C6EB|nr:type II secretion system protein GspM [Pseudomonas sp. R5(2019)]NBA96195.1 general secretion pathway protein GspM [Pseudomonas sp. R5(2019)]
MPHRLFPAWRQRWQQLQDRERTALIALCVFLATSAFYGLIWQPQREALTAAKARYHDEQQLADLIKRLPAVQPQTAARLQASDLPGLLTRSSADANLNLERMDTDSHQRVSLELAGGLVDLLGWLEHLTAAGAQVTTLALEVASDAQVRARLQLEAK